MQPLELLMSLIKTHMSAWCGAQFSKQSAQLFYIEVQRKTQTHVSSQLEKSNFIFCYKEQILNLTPSWCNNYFPLVYFYAHTTIFFYFNKNNHQHFANPIMKPHRCQARIYFDPHEVPWGCLASSMQRASESIQQDTHHMHFFLGQCHYSKRQRRWS